MTKSYAYSSNRARISWNDMLIRIFFCCFFFVSANLWSQLDSIHYFPPVHSRANGNIAEQYVYLSTPEVTPFVVTLVDGAGNFIGSTTISKDNPDFIYIGSGQVPGTDVAVPKDSVLTKLIASGFIASAPYDFYCNVRIRASFHATSIACKGRAAKGKEFYAGSMPQAISNANRNFVTSIMATENGTIVFVNGFDPAVFFESPGAPVGPDALTILLNEGDCYVLTGYTTTADANRDGFIGAKITSNKDIVVNTGCYLGSISTDGAQDAGMVQIVPTELIGTEHVVVAGGGGNILERPLVVATEDGTDIFINDILGPVATIDEGEYYLVPGTYYSGTLHQNMAIETSLPAYVFQNTAANTNSATSEFNFIPPLACYLTNSIDAIPDIDRIGPAVFDGVLYIITTTGSMVTVNGAVLGGGDGPEPAVGLPDWETYKITTGGDIAIESEGPMAAGFISVNGYAGAGAYYAGFNFDFQVDGGPDLDVCIGEEIILFGDGAGEGGYYEWDGGVEDSVAFVPGETMTYNLVGWNVEGCEDDDDVLVTIFELPTSNAGPDQELCDTSGTTLDGSNPLATGEGLWSFASGPSIPIFDDEEEPDTEVIGLVEGTYELVWAVSNGPCEAITDTVKIFVYDTPFSEAGASQDLCNEFSTNLEGSIPAGTATGLWTMVAGPVIPTFEDATLPGTMVSDLVLGEYTMVWTVSNGSCTPYADTMIIRVFVMPLSEAGLDQEFCGTYDLVLEGSDPGDVSTGLWTMEFGPELPLFSDPTNPLVTISDLIEGSYSFVWTISNEGCPDDSDTVEIGIYEPPTSNAGADQFLCEADGTVLNAIVPAGSSTGEWSIISGPTSPVFVDLTEPNTAISGLTLGEYILIWTVSNGICDEAIDSVKVTVNPYPEININSSTTGGCAPLAVTFSNFSTPTGDDCFWEFGDGSVASGCGDIFHSYEDGGDFDVTLTVTADGCTSSQTFTDYISVEAKPEASFIPSPNEINITNTTVEFRNYSINSVDYIWDFGDDTPISFDFEPIHTYPSTIEEIYTVTLIAMNELGCPDTAYGKVVFEDLLIFYVPNAFSPNGSGINDVFQPIITSRISPYDFNMKIFNRWGEIVFETYNYNVGWDGSYFDVLATDGVYVWRMEFADLNTDLRYEYFGHVTLLK